ncbi:flagellar basal body L-ring protein FlgH [Photobacterium damselae]|uniref:Flagellar basal body L-ring protein n=1 Tax=Photobacterium damselae TaxID=38293 RepID=A0ACD3SVS2_PHODM|nr:flagellar basal body L-ring protein FlgH [Photobacterium damselae]MBA5683423.1 flagellar basal body L-ring protein FlgH [Photobacterium damselae subsp. damselae]MCG9706736.1 flagellar basal body L-ring protein FlgH [Photobacterium damselae]NVH49328.1 flagellar basal body L-ring protein FlgH [Photobacterium damselae subsp. damselae]NVO80597.1 flagellar basal body L-ring protein FlgH [Photobacterium damselae subsp. damselae]RDL29405.1 flagellar basal body L-ring protein [Photobacterium damsel
MKSPIAGLLLLGLLQLVGCASTPNVPQSDIEKGTTTVDAVEGEQSESKGLIDKLRHREDPVAGDPAWGPVRPPVPAEHYVAATGSLFNQTHALDLYDDTRPHSIGDIVTILLEEKTAAKKSATSELDKSADMNMKPISLGGKPVTIHDYSLSYDFSNDNTFSGSSSADQSNSIKGSISVEVIDILANGNLVIRGEKWLTLNSGDEFIRVSGHIRPDDISQDNTIPSTRISNARIQYSGTGDRQDVQDQNWLSRFFNVAF